CDSGMSDSDSARLAPSHLPIDRATCSPARSPVFSGFPVESGFTLRGGFRFEMVEVAWGSARAMAHAVPPLIISVEWNGYVEGLDDPRVNAARKQLEGQLTGCGADVQIEHF